MTEQPTKSLAQQMHELSTVQDKIEEVIWNAFKRFNPEELEFADFHIGTDWYDNSIEIYFEEIIPYPFEPSMEIRKAIKACGFDVVYFNFIDENGKYTEKIRNNEPRRFKNAPHKRVKYGFVDDRFNEEHYLTNYRNI